MSEVGRGEVALDCEPDTDPAVIVDEALVEPYSLPDPLVFEDGTEVTAATWPKRRAETLRLLEDHVYGRTPSGPLAVTTEAIESGLAFDGLAERRQMKLS